MTTTTTVHPAENLYVETAHGYRQRVVVSPAVFDALRAAGLLAVNPPDDRCSWPTWGQETASGDYVICDLIEGERIETASDAVLAMWTSATTP